LNPWNHSANILKDHTFRLQGSGDILNNETQSASSAPCTPLDIKLEYSVVKTRRKRIRLLIIFLIMSVSLFWFIPPVYNLSSGSVTVTRWDRKFGETQVEVGPEKKGWIKAHAISKHVLHAFVAAEDGKFYSHSGFDFEQIEKSIQTNLKKKRYARGASTISQQVVKMAFLSREKSLLRKAREAAGTVLMEWLLTKDQILEWYINLAEFGDGVYGIAEGCEHYFKTKPDQLTIEQSVHLALVLPSPNSWSRGLRTRTLTPFGHKRFASILNNMKLSGYITKGQWQTALSRGDFGRPIHGYNNYLANEEKVANDCTAEYCGDIETDPIDNPEPENTSKSTNVDVSDPLTSVDSIHSEQQTMSDQINSISDFQSMTPHEVVPPQPESSLEQKHELSITPLSNPNIEPNATSQDEP